MNYVNNFLLYLEHRLGASASERDEQEPERFFARI